MFAGSQASTHAINNARALLKGSHHAGPGLVHRSQAQTELQPRTLSVQRPCRCHQTPACCARLMPALCWYRRSWSMSPLCVLQRSSPASSTGGRGCVRLDSAYRVGLVCVHGCFIVHVCAEGLVDRAMHGFLGCRWYFHCTERPALPA